MKTYAMADPVRYSTMTTGQIREVFLIDTLYEPGALSLAYVDLDRAVVGIAAPSENPIPLPSDIALRAQYFTERRELGVLNIGGSGVIHADGNHYSLENLDCLYIGRATREIFFQSTDTKTPAIFYLLSYPAHATYPTTLIRKEEADPVELGSVETCNRRTVCKYIYLDGAKSCQLVMGVTHLHPGSAWNTMPAHTHMRRSEIYMYFNLGEQARVFHLMGPAEETRHIVMKDREVVVSPGWSIHAGVGTQAYSFCWGMGGENQDYGDWTQLHYRACAERSNEGKRSIAMKLVLVFVIATIAIPTFAQTNSSAEVFSGGDVAAQLAKLAEASKTSGSSVATLGDYKSHAIKLSVRTASGGAEVHAHYDDIFFVTQGEATLITGGTVANAQTGSDGETKGNSIESGKSQTIAVNDVVHIPAGTPHQLIIAPGALFSAIVIKVKE